MVEPDGTDFKDLFFVLFCLVFIFVYLFLMEEKEIVWKWQWGRRTTTKFLVAKVYGL